MSLEKYQDRIDEAIDTEVGCFNLIIPVKFEDKKEFLKLAKNALEFVVYSWKND